MKSWLLFAVVALGCASRLDAADRPNVVVVLMDDFGWGDPSCYGNPLVKTPHIDRMAAEGVRFTQGYVAAPICSPSRCGIITGHFPARHKITSFLQSKAGNRACEMSDFLDPAAPGLPRMLKAAGYATAHVGKWHLGGGRDVTDAPKFAAYGYDLGLGTYESPEPAAGSASKRRPGGRRTSSNRSRCRGTSGPNGWSIRPSISCGRTPVSRASSTSGWTTRTPRSCRPRRR